MSQMKRSAQPKILFQLNLSPELHAELQREATEKRTTMSDVVRIRLSQKPVELKKAA
jgi:hypothetical protein